MHASSDTEMLLQQAAAGDQQAEDRLLDRHRDRLRRMIAVRMDYRLKRRSKPSS